MQKSKYASWMDSLLEKGISLSEFRRLVKEQFPGVSLSLASHVRYRRSQGWKIVEERREGGDVFYKVVEKPEKRQRKEKGSDDSRGVVQEPESVSVQSISKEMEEEGSEIGEESGESSKQKVVYGAGVYTLKEEDDGKFKLSVKVGTESKTVEFSDGDIEEVIGELFGGIAELKSVSREKGGVERGVFILYKIV